LRDVTPLFLKREQPPAALRVAGDPTQIDGRRRRKLTASEAAGLILILLTKWSFFLRLWPRLPYKYSCPVF
jgi:hypothetical protein